MRNNNCELCNGTGWYGDNGPGIRGNREYVPCEHCNPKADGDYAVFGDGWRDTRKVKPPRQDCYLVYDSEGSMFLCAYDTEFRHDGGIDGKAEIIAWRPLPDPPAFA